MAAVFSAWQKGSDRVAEVTLRGRDEAGSIETRLGARPNGTESREMLSAARYVLEEPGAVSATTDSEWVVEFRGYEGE
jgi:hypothetical protein